MFLITKKIGRAYYLYIVNSFRKKFAKRPTVQTIKYMGNTENYSEEEVSKMRELLKNRDPDIWKYINELKEKKSEIKKKELELKKEKQKEEENFRNLWKMFKEKKKRINKKKRIKREKDKCIICNFDIIIHAHHINPVANGGSFKKDNLINLCPNHHAMAHKGLITEEQLKGYKNGVMGKFRI